MDTILIDGVAYRVTADSRDEQITMLDVHELERELQLKLDPPIDMVWEDFLSLGEAVQKNPRHPDRMLLLPWAAWVALRIHGKKATFAECGRMEIELVPAPQDRREGKKGGTPTRKRKPKASPPVAAPAEPPPASESA